MCAVRSRAQEAAHPGAPATLVLPSEIPAGQRATLAVLDAAGRLVPDAGVALPGGEVTTDVTGRAVFTAPAQAGTMTAKLQDGAAFTSMITSTVVGAGAVAQGAANKKATPQVLALGENFTVRGPGFDPEADKNRVLLDGKAALVLASSAAEVLAVADPQTPLGATQLTVDVAGRELVRVPAIVVSLGVQGPTQGFGAGKKGVVQVVVTGTKERLYIVLRNLSPNVVRLVKGNTVQLTSSGGTNNIAKTEILGVSAGDYSISARLGKTP
jgi:hypothetical protein